MPQQPQGLNAVSQALCTLFILLLPFAIAGIALINTGLCRSRSAAHSMMSTLCVVGIAAAAYYVAGFSLEGFAGLPSHSFLIHGREWSWLGAGRWFMRDVPLDGSPASFAALLQMLTVGLAALIPLGAAAERWRLGACCVSTALFAGLTFPMFAHWVWGAGWLGRAGMDFGLGMGFLDAGGSSTIQAVGGLTALSMVWLLGPRRGKFNLEGMPAALPGHNTVLVLFGCLLALVGWMGLNCAGSILFVGAQPGRTVLVSANTLLSAAGGVLAAAAITRYRFGRPDASLSANGWLCGLVASSAGCAFVAPASALLTGLVAGALASFTVAWMESRLGIDDPAGAISVHAIGGIWGVLAVGVSPLAAGIVGNSGPVASTFEPRGQFLVQLVGVATLIGVVLPFTYSLNWLLNRVIPQRIPLQEERQGADLYELGAGAYPEFMTHTDEFSQW